MTNTKKIIIAIVVLLVLYVIYQASQPAIPKPVVQPPANNSGLTSASGISSLITSASNGLSNILGATTGGGMTP